MARSNVEDLPGAKAFAQKVGGVVGFESSQDSLKELDAPFRTAGNKIIMMKSLSFNGIRFGTKLPIVPERILWQWIRLNQESGWFATQTAPWWFNERASLSLFAGAIWRCNGRAFEEYSTAKVLPSKHKPIKWRGRCDLSFEIGEQEYLAESKQCWPTLAGDASTAFRTARQYLDEACADVLCVPADGASRIGICFVSPMLHKSRHEAVDEHVQSFIRRMTTIKGTTVAWTFPKKARKLMPDGRYSQHAFPGIAILFKRAR